MFRWKSLQIRVRWLVAATCLAVAGMVVVACSMRRSSAPETVKPAAAPTTTPTLAQSEPAPAPGLEECSGSSQLLQPEVVEPLSETQIAAWEARITAEQDDASRIRLRRGLAYRLCRAQQLELAVPQFASLLEEVERQKGGLVAERAALADGGQLRSLKEDRMAVAVYDLLLSRWPESRFAAEALYHQGECYLDLEEYAAAERVWQQLLESHDESPLASWGWRKLALAQLVQGRFDESLATLKVMAGKYAGTEFGEYATMRQGYVQMMAGRFAEAQASYAVFLTTCASSKYCVLAQQQMKELEQLAARNGQPLVPATVATK